MCPPNLDLLLFNANVVTVDRARPRANWVAIADGRIAALGTGPPPQRSTRPGANVDCQGATLIPGFHDAHCHVLATAASLTAVDCSPKAATSIADIQYRLRERSAGLPAGAWIRGTGYNEFYLRERRHLTRWDLDQAVPNHPVRLLHRTGHATVLNSFALQLVNIHAATADPPDGVIERDPSTGEPTGLLLEMEDYLSGAVPPLSRTEMQHGVAVFNNLCLSLGITSLQDASPGNAMDRWRHFRQLKDGGKLTPSVTFMVGIAHLPSFLEAGLTPGSGVPGLRVGAAKIVLTMTTGDMQPPRDELHRMVIQAHRAGFQVAIHAVEAEAVEAAVEAIEAVTHASPSTDLRHRIEHCSECPPGLVRRIAGSGITVVTQPGFLYHGGERYLAEVPPERQPWLYPIGALAAAGVPLAAASDSPVIGLNPLIGLYAAATRKGALGEVVLPEQGIAVERALEMYTLGGAYVSFQERDLGSIQVGKWADLTLLDHDPTSATADALLGIKTLMTVVRGAVAWEG